MGEAPLEVGIVSTCAVATPPRAYGGTELVLADLARELIALGHRPTVFATADSRVAGLRCSLFDEPVWPPDPLAELRHSAFAWERIASGHFDVVHLNTPTAICFRSFVDVPAVATVHHPHIGAVAAHYAAHPEIYFAAISRRQRDLSPEVPFRAVVHHGIRVDDYPLGDGSAGYCAYLGRFAREKGTHLAIAAAKAAGCQLRLAGSAHTSELEYFERHVVPGFDADAICIGEVDYEKKVELLRSAQCLLMPIQWEEPFGLVLIEAMLVGTPVIAFATGSVPEIVDDGVTGFLCTTVEQMASRIRQVGAIDRRRCRERARARWSAARMARDYVELYRRAISAARRVHTRGSRGHQHVSARLGRAW